MLKLLLVLSAVIATRVSCETPATRVLLTQAVQEHGAMCLDGSPAALYLRPGSGTGLLKWFIHHQGGGWCESLDLCLDRSRQSGATSLGSSKGYPPTAPLPGGYLSQDPTVNPMMYNWNVAYLRYCDGGSFTGLNNSITIHKGSRLYFRGLANLRAMQQYLLGAGLKHATDVVIGGESAGGLATYLHVDDWANVLKAPGRKVVGMPDSGFFPYYNGTTHFSSGMHWVFHFMNSTAGVHPRCISDHAAEGNEQECFFAQHAVRYIQTPIFALQSQYDSDQMRWAEINAIHVARINQWGQHMTHLVEENLLASGSHGVFLDSCFHHCWGWGHYSTGGVTQPKAFEEWYEKGSRGLANKGYFRQDNLYPCEACCHGAGKIETDIAVSIRYLSVYRMVYIVAATAGLM